MTVVGGGLLWSHQGDPQTWEAAACPLDPSGTVARTSSSAVDAIVATTDGGGLQVQAGALDTGMWERSG